MSDLARRSMRVVVLLLSFFSVLNCDRVTFYKPCDSEGQLVRVDVMPCDAEDRDPACKLPRDGFVTLTLIFTSPTEIRAAKPSAYVNLNGTKVSVPFTMEKDSCQRFETSCPLAPNVEHTYTTSVFVSGTYGKLRTVAEWQIHDQNDQKVTCLTLPVELV